MVASSIFVKVLCLALPRLIGGDSYLLIQPAMLASRKSDSRSRCLPVRIERVRALLWVYTGLSYAEVGRAVGAPIAGHTCTRELDASANFPFTPLRQAFAADDNSAPDNSKRDLIVGLGFQTRPPY